MPPALVRYVAYSGSYTLGTVYSTVMCVMPCTGMMFRGFIVVLGHVPAMMFVCMSVVCGCMYLCGWVCGH